MESAVQLSWTTCLPVVLRAAQERQLVSFDLLEDAVGKEFPSASVQELKGMTAARFHATRAARRAVHLGFLDRKQSGEFSLTAEGREWLSEKTFPLNEEESENLIKQLESSSTFGFDVMELKTGFFWVVRTGREGEREEVSLHDNAVYPGMHLGDEADIEFDQKALKSKISSKFPELTKNGVSSVASQLNRIRSHMEIGDLVLMPSKLHSNRIYVGRVSGDYVYDKNAVDPEMRHKVPVEWRDEPIERTDLGKDLRNKLGSLLTICRISKNNALARVESVLAGNGDFELDKYNSVEDTYEESDTSWIAFYEELADKLIQYKDDRAELLNKLNAAAAASNRASMFDMLFSWARNGIKEPATDVDPFSIYAAINRQITWSNKRAVCTGLKEAFDIEADVPNDFNGVPQVSNMKSKFETQRGDAGNPEFYSRLWMLFEAALNLAEEDSPARRIEFEVAFDAATQGRSPVLYTMALFWIRANSFLNLDSLTQSFLSQEEVLGSQFLGPNGSGEQYLQTLDLVREWLEQGNIEPASFVGVSWEAWKRASTSTAVESEDEEADPELSEKTFSIDDVMKAGCFLPRESLQAMLSRWKEKKNLILQGPPGTGKTWLARKLAQALAGTDSDENISVVQFHPSTSYEDFIQGFRPSGDGKLELADGPFLELLQPAFENKNQTYVMVIEEINRGNPAQIFGEMLTLLEADKRGVEHGLRTLYGDKGSKLFLPPNFYVIGTMNQADRSLALVDMALRRRFAFVTLKPELGESWVNFCVQNKGRDRGALQTIAQRLNKVNKEILDDPSLGAAFEIGHSFVTPNNEHEESSYEATMRWFDAVVETDLVPLLEEYWFDNSELLATNVETLRGA